MADGRKRIYVAGPCTGYPDLNFPAFDAETARLRALGYEVSNPAEINAGAMPALPEDQIKHWRLCMRLDIPQLCTCDAIVMLPGWEKSKGATLEHHIATALGMPVLHAGQEIAA